MFGFGKKKPKIANEKKEVSITMATAADIKKELERAAKNLKALTDALVAERAKVANLTTELEASKAKNKELEGGQSVVKTGTDALAEANAAAEAVVNS